MLTQEKKKLLARQVREKQARGQTLARAAGEMGLRYALVLRILREVPRPYSAPPRDPAEGMDPALLRRLRAVGEAMALGLPRSEVAARLGLSEEEELRALMRAHRGAKQVVREACRKTRRSLDKN